MSPQNESDLIISSLIVVFLILIYPTVTCKFGLFYMSCST